MNYVDMLRNCVINQKAEKLLKKKETNTSKKLAY